MSYELFISSHSVSADPFISLMKEGFQLNAAFVKKHQLERATAVRVYFDRTRSTIGFQFPAGTQPQDGALRLKRHAGGLVVRAKGFFRSPGIDPAKHAGRYEPREVKDGVLKRLIVIKLRAPASHGRKTPKA